MLPIVCAECEYNEKTNNVFAIVPSVANIILSFKVSSMVCSLVEIQSVNHRTLKSAPVMRK